MRTVVSQSAWGILSLWLSSAAAEELTVELIDIDGNRTSIATLEMSPAITQRNQGRPDNGVAPGDNRVQEFSLQLNEQVFSNEFLSMRPFKCLRHKQRMLCRLEYPYPKDSVVSDVDLRNLEYDLLFIEKSANEYGINAWNGRYFKLQRVAGGFSGLLHEVDLDVLAVPPHPDTRYPITNDMLHPADVETSLYPSLEIQ